MATPEEIERRTGSVKLAVQALSHPGLSTPDIGSAVVDTAEKIDKFIREGETTS